MPGFFIDMGSWGNSCLLHLPHFILCQKSKQVDTNTGKQTEHRIPISSSIFVVSQCQWILDDILTRKNMGGIIVSVYCHSIASGVCYFPQHAHWISYEARCLLDCHCSFWLVIFLMSTLLHYWKKQKEKKHIVPASFCCPTVLIVLSILIPLQLSNCL